MPWGWSGKKKSENAKAGVSEKKEGKQKGEAVGIKSLY